MSSFPEILLVLPTDTSSRTGRVRLERMFNHHHRFIWRLLRRLGLSAERADDATQQVFLVAAERIEDIRKESERAFLFGSALRIARTHARHDRRWLPDADMADHLGTSVTPEDLCDRHRAIDALDRALAGMDLDLRTVLVLFELEGLSMAEIASMADLPPGTVASRLRRAREALRNALGVAGSTGTRDRP